MKTKRNAVLNRSAWLGVMAMVASLHTGDMAMAQATSRPPERMTYQGFIAGTDGVALGNTAPKNYDVIFRVYDAETAGTLLWGEQQTVTVDKGYFSVLLGEGAAVSGIPNAGITMSSLFNSANASDRYVEFTVKGIGSGGANVDILPRGRMMSAPYAFLASRAIVAETATLADRATLADKATLATNAVTAQSATKLINSTTGAELLTSSGNTLTINANLGITGSNVINLGSDKTKGTYNGSIGYQFASDGLDIFGAGSSVETRKIRFWNNGEASFIGPVKFEGVITPAGGMSVPGTRSIELGGGLTKTPYAGHIGYQTFSGDGLDILGAGTTDATRRIRIWNEGGMSMNGYVSIAAGHSTVGFPLYVGGPLNSYSIYATEYIATKGTITFSDLRVKDVIGVSDKSQDVENLRRIRVTDYTLKQGGIAPKRFNKGVIAQEIREVLPNAVSTNRNFIPIPPQDSVSVEQGEPLGAVIVRFAAGHGFQKDESLNLELDGRSQQIQVLNVPDEKSFEFKAGLTSVPKQVRVVGREVNDFQSVDYQQIYMTAVSALQEVDRRLQLVEQREAKVMELERKAARVDTLERDFAELRKLVAVLQAGAAKSAGSASVTGSGSGAVVSSR